MGSVTTSVMDDAQLRNDFVKKINTARETMKAFDQLSPAVRKALATSKVDFSASHLLELKRHGWPDAALVAAIEAQQPPDR